MQIEIEVAMPILPSSYPVLAKEYITSKHRKSTYFYSSFDTINKTRSESRRETPLFIRPP
jgi:hypothetical protein